MAQLTKIRSDVHGLYVRTNGAIYRPYRSEYTEGYRVNVNGESKFIADDRVKVSAVSQSCLCRVGVGTSGIEFWSMHGSYWDKNRPGKPGYPNVLSEECWKPGRQYKLAPRKG